MVDCPITGSPDNDPWMLVPDRFNPDGPLWQLVRSRGSGLVMLDPCPDAADMAQHYAHSDYDPFLADHDGPHSPALRSRMRLLARRLLLHYRARLVAAAGMPLTPDSRLLEIGCAGGELLDALGCIAGISRNGENSGSSLRGSGSSHRGSGSSHRGSSCSGNSGSSDSRLFGVEPHPESAARARNRYGITVHTSLDRVTDPGSVRGTVHAFDRIIFWHSLEHLHDLDGTLRHAAHLLAPGGSIVIALPCHSCRAAARYGAGWVAWDAPRHLYHFTPETLTALLSRHGLRVTRMRPYLPDTLYNALESTALGLRSGAEGMYWRPFVAYGRALLAAAVDSALVLARRADPDGLLCYAIKVGECCLPAR